MIVRLLTEHHLAFLSLKESCRGSSESTHVKMPHCWKSHALAHLSSTERNYLMFIKNVAYLLCLEGQPLTMPDWRVESTVSFRNTLIILL